MLNCSLLVLNMDQTESEVYQRFKKFIENEKREINILEREYSNNNLVSFCMIYTLCTLFLQILLFIGAPATPIFYTIIGGVIPLVLIIIIDYNNARK